MDGWYGVRLGFNHAWYNIYCTEWSYMDISNRFSIEKDCDYNYLGVF